MRQPPKARSEAAARRKSPSSRNLTQAIRLAVTKSFLPIHREAPAFSEQSTELEILVTGIKARWDAVQHLHTTHYVQQCPSTRFGGRRCPGEAAVGVFPLEGFL